MSLYCGFVTMRFRPTDSAAGFGEEAGFKMPKARRHNVTLRPADFRYRNTGHNLS
jgi:hypothetical protein